MGKFTTAYLDFVDLENAMRFIGACHDGKVDLTISPRGTGANGGFWTSVQFTGDALPGSDQLRMLSVNGTWPTKEGTALVGHLFAAVYQLDWLLTQDLNEKIKAAELPPPG